MGPVVGMSVTVMVFVLVVVMVPPAGQHTAAVVVVGY